LRLGFHAAISVAAVSNGWIWPQVAGTPRAPPLTSSGAFSKLPLDAKVVAAESEAMGTKGPPP
jgi:hypothetical protein